MRWRIFRSDSVNAVEHPGRSWWVLQSKGQAQPTIVNKKRFLTHAKTRFLAVMAIVIAEHKPYPRLRSSRRKDCE
jgi:hypothetical protein